MLDPTKTWDTHIKESLLPKDEACSTILLSSINHWWDLHSLDKRMLLNLKAQEQATAILRNTIKQMNARYKTELEKKDRAEKEKIIQSMVDAAYHQMEQLHEMSTAITDMDALLAHVPNNNTPPLQTKNTQSALETADLVQTAASAAGGLASASVQESADFAARASHVSNQTLVALRDPLPPSIASGAHIASVVASGLNLIAFPIILLIAYARGEKVHLSKEDTGRLGKSVVTLGLGIAGLVVAPAIAIPLMIASAVFAAGTTLIGLGNFLWNKHKQTKVIEEKRRELTALTKEIATLQSKAFKDFENGVTTFNDAYQSYREKVEEQTVRTQTLKALIKHRDQAGTLRQVVPRSLGFILGAALIVGAVLLLVPPLAPVGIGIIIGTAAAGVAVAAGAITANVMLARKEKAKAKEKTEAQIEMQKIEKNVHETTAELVTRLGIATNELSHQARVKQIIAQLDIITQEIQHTKKDDNTAKNKLIQFFVKYCEAHQEDHESTLKAKTIFYEIPERIRNAAFAQMRTLVNAEGASLISKKDLATLQQFDDKHQFFQDHSINVFVVKKEEKNEPSAEPNRDEDHPNHIEPR